MRRPTGFDAPPLRPPGRGAGDERRRRGPARTDRSREAATESTASPAPSPEPPEEAITEPIAIVPPSSGEAVESGGQPQHPSAASRGAAPLGRRRGWGALWDSSRRSVSQRWRRARRARRRVERSEIRRFTERVRRRRRFWWISLGSVVAVVALVAGVAVSPLLALHHITITGAHRVDAEQLVDELSPMRGTPLALLDHDAIDRALNDVKLVESYSIETKPPDTLVIHLTERTPIGVVRHGKKFQVVDAAGVVISSAATQPDDYPLIETKKSADFDAAAAVLRALPDDVFAEVTSVSASSADDVTLKLDGDHEVVWGGPEHSELKASVLSALITATDSDAAVYDVSSPHTPVTR